jgi:hypothetical protein
MLAMAGTNNHATRLKSGAIQRYSMAHQQRAEIFALPFALLAPFAAIPSS